MNVTSQTMSMGWVSLVLLVLGTVGAIYITLTDPDSPLAKGYALYANSIDVELRTLFIQSTTGRYIANWQIGVMAASLIANLVLNDPIAFIVIPVAVIAPKLWLLNARNERQTKIEAQLDTFLLCCANALKASPSLGDALSTCTGLLRSPIKEELDLTMKENSLGVALDQALMNMANRVNSRAFSGSLTTILIGRQTGGDLPRILETSAGTLREMARLEGVVRSKTAEGKAQAWVLGAVPPFLVGILNYIDPEWLKPLSTTIIGYIIVVIAVAFWVVAVFAARKILAVDI